MRDGEPTNPSLFALSEARRIAHAAGLTVFALVLSPPLPAPHIEKLAAAFGLAGADRVLVCEGENLGAPPLDATHGRALLTATECIPPILVFFPAGGPGDELGPSLAVRMGGAFGRAVDIELSDEPGPLADGVGRLRLCRWRADRSGLRRLDPVEIERPVIAILGAHGQPGQPGTADIDVEILACVPPPSVPVVELATEPDELAAIGLARGLIVAGPGVGAELVARLQTAAPAGVVVVNAAQASPVALAASSPEFVLELGRSQAALEVGISPRTRLGRVELDPPAPSAPGDGGGGRGDGGGLAPDLVWRVDLTGAGHELVTALQALGSNPTGGGGGA